MFNGKRLSGWMALAVFATVGGAMVAADPAFAKLDVDNLTIGGEIRERYEFRTNDTFNAGQGKFGTAPFASTSGAVKAQKGNESGASQRIRLGVAYDLTPDVSFYMQMQDSRSFGSECFNSNAGGSSGAQCASQVNSNQSGIDLHQGYLQVKNILVKGLSLKAGRQEIKYGDHRLLGDFNWSQQGNAFDGVKLSQTTEKVDLDLFWARIIDPSATAFQASNNNVQFPSGLGSNGTKVGAGQAGNNQDLYGAYMTLKPVKTWTVEPYWFLLQDARATQLNGTAASGVTGLNATTTTFSSVTGAQAPAQTRNFLGGRINGKQDVAGIKWDLTYEGNYQFGSIASNCERNKTAAACGRNTAAGGFGVLNRSVTGDREAHINATQQAIKTGFTFENVPMKPRLGYEFDYASGDKCANGSNAANTLGCATDQRRHFNTADNLFPTNHFKYGAMDLMAWKNMVAHQIVFDVKPSAVSKLQFNYNMLRLANTADNWYRSGQGTYFTSKVTNQAASLGQELDVHYWHTFKEKFKFDIGFGHFFAGEYLTKSASGGATSGLGAFSNTQGSFSNGFGSQTHVVGQNWGYVMGSILF